MSTLRERSVRVGGSDSFTSENFEPICYLCRLVGQSASAKKGVKIQRLPAAAGGPESLSSFPQQSDRLLNEVV